MGKFTYWLRRGKKGAEYVVEADTPNEAKIKLKKAHHITDIKKFRVVGRRRTR